VTSHRQQLKPRESNAVRGQGAGEMHGERRGDALRRAVRPSSLVLAVGGLTCLLSACSSQSKHGAITAVNATGGVSSQNTGGSSGVGGSVTNGGNSSSSVTLVAVPNDEDGPPVSKPAGLAPTPPMGWNSWNAYGTGITAALIKSVADLMVSNGMRDAGYTYVNIDDGWTLSTRVAPGSARGDGGADYLASDAGDSVLVPNAAFGGPTGIRDLADYVHSKGLKLGIYSDRGAETCGHFAASGGHELTDARTFASWGIDYLKYDNCPSPAPTGTELMNVYQTMRDALNVAMSETQHDIVFSLCSWAFNEWNLQTGQLWRTTGDIAPVFNDRSLLTNTYSNTILQNAAMNKIYAAYAGPNNWNDPDMLEVGNNISLIESRTHFGLWAIMSAPLIAGNKLDRMSSEVLAILTNTQVIAVDQDYLGLQGVPVKSTDTTEVWGKPLNKAGARAVLLLNAGTQTQNMSVDLTDIALSAGTATVHDLWSNSEQWVQNTFAVDVVAHGSVMVEIDGDEPGIPQGTVYLSDIPWTYAANGVGPVERDTSNGSSTRGDGKPLTIRGTSFAKGLGVAAGSKVIFRLAKRCSRFSALVGVDDESAASGTALMQVWADDEKLFDSGKMTGTDQPKAADVDLSGKRKLKLLVTAGGVLTSLDHADWADAKLTCAP
jgi:alpha-galactosidase